MIVVLALDMRQVATENFHDLHARLLSGEMVKFTMFKNMVPWLWETDLSVGRARSRQRGRS